MAGRCILLGAAIGLIFAGPVLGQEGESARAAREQARSDVKTCVRENVPRVESAIESLDEGVVFLTQRLCATAVAQLRVAEQRLQQELTLMQMRERCLEEEGQGGGFFSGLSGDYGACQTVAYLELESDTYTDPRLSGIGVIGQPTPDIVALAAEMLLEARLARGASAP